MKHLLRASAFLLLAASAWPAEPPKPVVTSGHVRVINQPNVGVIVAVDLDVDGTPGDGVIDEIIVGLTKEQVEPFEAIAAIYSYTDDLTLHIMRGDGGRGLTLWGGPSKLVEIPSPMQAVHVRGIAHYSGGGVKGRLDDLPSLPMLQTLPRHSEAQRQRRLEEAAAELRRVAQLPEWACRPCYPPPPPPDPDWPNWPPGGGPSRSCTSPVCINGGQCHVTCHSPEFPICGCLADGPPAYGAPACTCG